LLGASLGGMTSILMASRYSSYIKKLILQAPPWEEDCINLDISRKAITFASKYPSLVKFAGKVQSKVNRKVLLAVTKKVNKHFFQIESKTGVIYHSFKTMDMAAASDIWNNIKDVNLSKYLKRIESPTLIISGDHDEQVKPDKTRELTKLIKHSKFKLLRGADCTHTLFFDKPEEMAGIVESFLKEYG
jgi:pimeloyl-ACP methyl ester carboxylesterase